MSLINKMLSDLESREVLLADKQDVMLDGLYSAYDVEIENKPDNRKYYYVLLTIAVLLFTVYASNEPGFPVIDKNDSGVSGSTNHQFIDLPPVNISAVADITGAGETPVVEEYRFSLKLDDLLESYDVAPTEATIVKNGELIENIDIQTSGEKIILTMDMPVDAHYSLYTLEMPHRTVLQISDMDYADALPAIEKHPQITNLRKRRDEDGNFVFVMESANPLSIVNSGYQQSGNDYKLQITLLPVQESPKPVTNNSRQVSGVEKSVQSPEAVVQGDLIKSLHQPRPVNATDKMLSDGITLYEQGQIAESLDKLYATVKSDESHVRARATLAVILVEQGQDEMAVSLLEDGVRQFPEQTAWTRLLARMHIDAGKLAQAREVLSRSVPEITADPEYHALYAALLQKMEVHNEAARTYRNLVSVQPDNGLWWMGLAISLEAISRNNDALFAYKNALNGQSLTPETHRYIIERIRYLDSRRSRESS